MEECYPILSVRGRRKARRMSEFAPRISCPIGPVQALEGPNGATWDSPGCNPGFESGIDPSALKGPDRAVPNGATWDSLGCNPGFASGIDPSALKGPDRDTPRFRRIQYGSPARQALKGRHNRHYALSGLGMIFVFGPIPRALPWAIPFCPFGAAEWCAE